MAPAAEARARAGRGFRQGGRRRARDRPRARSAAATASGGIRPRAAATNRVTVYETNFTWVRIVHRFRLGWSTSAPVARPWRPWGSTSTLADQRRVLGDLVVEALGAVRTVPQLRRHDDGPRLADLHVKHGLVEAGDLRADAERELLRARRKGLLGAVDLRDKKSHRSKRRGSTRRRA